jgi:argininosuccinate lyase
LAELSLADLKSISDYFERDVGDMFSVTTSLNSRSEPGGTAPGAMIRQLAAAEEILAARSAS